MLSYNLNQQNNSLEELAPGVYFGCNTSLLPEGVTYNFLTVEGNSSLCRIIHLYAVGGTVISGEYINFLFAGQAKYRGWQKIRG